LLEQLEIFLSDKAPFKTHILAKAWKIGSESVPILSHDQVLPLLEKKVEDVRKITNVTPLY
jgi:hypothetical protein